MLDHQRELDLDTDQGHGFRPEYRSGSFLLLAPSRQFLSIGFVKSERFRLGVPPRSPGGKLSMQGGTDLLRTVA